MNTLNPFVQAMLTDLYQITMSYAYWRNNVHNRHAVFELFFREHPFRGEYAIVAGLQEALDFVRHYGFGSDDIAYLKSVPALSHCPDAFWEWLAATDTTQLTISALPEGSPAFSRVPLVRVEGPLAVAQLLETTLLNLINFSTLIATNAARLRYVAGDDATLVEFGLRRAQGPDGAMTATHSAIIGGFDATSNVLAGKLTGVPLQGTHAHAFVQSFTGLSPELCMIADSTGTITDVQPLLQQAMNEDGLETNEGELAAFMAYAQAFPDSTLLLVDTYDTLGSGLPNAVRVFKVLRALGHVPLGVRLDSGDLAFLSKEARALFDANGFTGARIVASNDINEEVLNILKMQGARIDVFGIGTKLVTASEQPSLGGVYKLVEVDGVPRIKISQEPVKMTIPGRKNAYRLTGKEGYYIADVMTLDDEPAPETGQPYLCCHPFAPEKRVRVIPSRVEPLLETVYTDGRQLIPDMTVQQLRDRSRILQQGIRPDHRRLLNPTPYKVSLSEKLFNLMRELWLHETPVKTIVQ